MKRSRTCGKCGARKRKNTAGRLVCDVCNRARAKAWSRDNPDRRRAIANKHRRTDKSRATSRAYYAANAERIRVQTNARRASSPARRAYERWYWLRANYGITPEQWTALFVSQGERCGCCRSTDPGSKRGWHTDHNHTTGRVRGILCHGCNHMLGGARDSVSILAAGVRYLEASC